MIAALIVVGYCVGYLIAAVLLARYASRWDDAFEDNGLCLAEAIFWPVLPIVVVAIWLGGSVLGPLIDRFRS